MYGLLLMAIWRHLHTLEILDKKFQIYRWKNVKFNFWCIWWNSWKLALSSLHHDIDALFANSKTFSVLEISWKYVQASTSESISGIQGFVQKCQPWQSPCWISGLQSHNLRAWIWILLTNFAIATFPHIILSLWNVNPNTNIKIDMVLAYSLF